jgi:tetratricopeptide (TPR) repeat protein
LGVFAERSSLPLLQNGQAFWVRPAPGKLLLWLRFGALGVLLPALLLLWPAFGAGHDPVAPAPLLNMTLLLILLANVWMLLIDLWYCLAVREQRHVVAHLIALGMGAGLLLGVRVMTELLDLWLTPIRHGVALLGLLLMFLLTAAAPVCKIWLLREPVIERFVLERGQRRHQPWLEMRLRQTMQARPEAVAPPLLLAELLLLQGRLQEGWTLLRKLAARFPHAWGTWATLGVVALANEHWERAASALSRADELAPRGARGTVHLYLGLALLGVEQPEAAKAAIVRAARWPLPPHLRHYRWFVLLRIGQVQEDSMLMMRAISAIKNAPDDALAFLDWYKGIDRSNLPTLGEDLYEAADWTRHLFNIRRVAT